MSVGDLNERPDLIGRDFAPRASPPGHEWCEGITFNGARTEFIYLATFLDCCTKNVAGYAMTYCMRTALRVRPMISVARRCLFEQGVTIFLSFRLWELVHACEILRWIQVL